MKKVLILAANPKGTSQLRLDEELRDIAEGLRRAQKRDEFSLDQKLAVRPRDIQRALLDYNPNIIHFSGHGSGEEGLVFEDESGKSKLVSGDALAGLFELFVDRIECVVLNGCYSEVQAKAIAQHINYVVGMSRAIGDKAAIEFAVGFYDALGAGRPIEFAYKLGCSAIRIAGIEEHLTPVLLKRMEVTDTVIGNISTVESSPKPAMNITGDEPEELHKAIINAYPDYAELERVIYFKLNENLNVIAGTGKYGDVVYELIKWADAEGKLETLIVELYNNKPGNPKLKAIKQKLMPYL
ncbi:effector-associated domain EAD1-containing protein [Scytonema sp. PRP1]|uniref:effector-associated domain EAD1-containing protein n=1 Tax=Scytonema sp. PRP1 TaxID=3120513 RepID=UPI002FD65CE0